VPPPSDTEHESNNWQSQIPRTIVTISAGVAHMTPTRPSIKEWLEGADGALYRAKQLGRNRVVVAAGV